MIVLESNLNSSKRACRAFIHSSERGSTILDETLLQDARAQIEAAFAQATPSETSKALLFESARAVGRTGPHLRPNAGLVAAPRAALQTPAALARLRASIKRHRPPARLTQARPGYRTRIFLPLTGPENALKKCSLMNADVDLIERLGARSSMANLSALSGPAPAGPCGCTPKVPTWVYPRRESPGSPVPPRYLR